MMKTKSSKNGNGARPTLADLIETVTQMTRDERVAAYIVAHMINSRRVSLEGDFSGRRVQVA
jgi:hypothetical protein